VAINHWTALALLIREVEHGTSAASVPRLDANVSSGNFLGCYKSKDPCGSAAHPRHGAENAWFPVHTIAAACVTPSRYVATVANRIKAGPDIAAVQRAFQMASGLPTHERVRLRVGILSSEGLMLSTGTLRGFEQAGLLRDQLQLLGFVEYVPARQVDAMGCDVLLKHVPDTAAQATDLLRTEEPLWPPVRGRGNPPPH
jgi:hypothetical protein